MYTLILTPLFSSKALKENMKEIKSYRLSKPIYFLKGNIIRPC